LWGGSEALCGSVFGLRIDQPFFKVSRPAVQLKMREGPFPFVAHNCLFVYFLRGGRSTRSRHAMVARDPDCVIELISCLCGSENIG
jgi:hypothetical protein